MTVGRIILSGLSICDARSIDRTYHRAANCPRLVRVGPNSGPHGFPMSRLRWETSG